MGSNTVNKKEIFNYNESIKKFDEVIKSEFNECNIDDIDIENLRKMFEFALKHKELNLFPYINVGNAEDLVKRYIINWCSKYFRQIYSKESSNRLKESGEIDNALSAIIKRKNSYSDSEISNYQKGHFLFMSAENINGIILEKFLNHIIKNCGFLWCAGQIYKATDFVNFNNGSPVLLQVKNKYNTENSSSDKIRDNTSIIRWYRLAPPIKKNPYMPISNWERLISDIVEECNLSEEKIKYLNENLNSESYFNFIKENNY